MAFKKQHRDLLKRLLRTTG